jgi:hypothetical protein
MRRRVDSLHRLLMVSMIVVATLAHQKTTLQAAVVRDVIEMRPSSEFVRNLVLKFKHDQHYVSLRFIDGDPPTGELDHLVITQPYTLVVPNSVWYLAAPGAYFAGPDRYRDHIFPQIGLDPAIFPPGLPGAPVQISSDAFYAAFERHHFIPVGGGGSIQFQEYGWAKFQRTSEVDFILLESASTVSPHGIVVGQYREVPEPRSRLLVAVAAILTSRIGRRTHVARSGLGLAPDGPLSTIGGGQQRGQQRGHSGFI